MGRDHTNRAIKAGILQFTIANWLIKRKELGSPHSVESEWGGGCWQGALKITTLSSKTIRRGGEGHDRGERRLHHNRDAWAGMR